VSSKAERPDEVILMTASQPTLAILNDASARNTP
jgi:hypothetical protein